MLQPSGTMSQTFIPLVINGQTLMCEKYRFGTLGGFLYIDLFKGLENHYLPRKCGLCGRYFLLEATAYSAFCTRPIKGNRKKTCRDLGHRKNYADKQAAENEQLRLITRELSHLNSNYRHVMVAHYVDGLSVKEISERFSLSQSMVKYLLFQSRKRIREGINMERTYGKLSYRPVELDLFFWGGKNNYYDKFDSRLAQNIMMACYYDKQNEEQISLQPGVPTAYLEDDISENVANTHSVVISTHTPTQGVTNEPFRHDRYQTYFNSHPHAGGDLCVIKSSYRFDLKFQLTPPRGG